jgi:transglutaminase-like putative cysteine protease
VSAPEYREEKEMRLLKVVLIFALAIIAGVPLYALPATLSLPPGQRPGVEPLTISEAVAQLQASGKSGMDLVQAARSLVAERMAYSRRNSFDIPNRAFERGYGFCIQQAYALTDLLSQLGFTTKVIHAFRNRFPDGTVSGHAWVRVIVDGQEFDVDSIHYDASTLKVKFTPISQVLEVSPAFGLFAGWGCTAVNAHRYYMTGKDRDW